MAKKEEKVKFIAEFSVENATDGKNEVIRTMSSAWTRAMDLPRPVKVRFLRLVRVDD